MPTPRIFISYRSSDGKDKATALARELGGVFGDAQVFLDKDDLRGGSAWRAEVQRLLGQRPVLLLLMTPQLLAAIDTQGRLRINDPEDPVRAEFSEALAAGARIIPVLCDGLDAPPASAELPAPFDQIGERTWRKLRAYDWAADVQRLVQDLQDLGVKPRAAAPPAAAASTRRRWVVPALVLALGAGVAGGAWLAWRSALPSGVAGTWDAVVVGHAPFRVVLQQEGGKLSMTSYPVPIAGRAEWEKYRAFWRERNGAELNHVVYRGEGRLRTDPGVPPAIDVAFQVLSSPGDVGVDGGQIEAALSADGKKLTGKLWLNGEQAESAIVLHRTPG